MFRFLCNTIAGIVFIVWKKYSFKIRCNTVISGTLAYLDERADRDAISKMPMTYYIPIYEYEVDNMVYHVRADKYSYDATKFKHQEACDIKYNPKKPSECLVDGKRAKCILETQRSNEKPILERIRRGNI